MALVEMVCGFFSPMHLVFGPMLVHRRGILSALAIPCVETEPPGHHEDAPGGKSVDARIRRPARTLRAQYLE